MRLPKPSLSGGNATIRVGPRGRRPHDTVNGGDIIISNERRDD